MLGLMAVSDDGEICVVILPSPLQPELVLVYVQYLDIDLPPVPIPVDQLKNVLGVKDGKK